MRLAIAHEHRGFRDGLRALLESRGDLAVVGTIDSVDRAAALLGETSVDILLVYDRISTANLPAISHLSSKVAVIVVIDDSSKDGIALPAVRAGARGVVLNHLAIDGVDEAIRTVALGHVSIPPSLQARVVADLRQISSMPLTSREREVTRLVATGLRNGEIAGELSISEQTVKKHLNNIFQKLELRDRVELARYALRNSLVGDDSARNRARRPAPKARGDGREAIAVGKPPIPELGAASPAGVSPPRGEHDVRDYGAASGEGADDAEA